MKKIDLGSKPSDIAVPYDANKPYYPSLRVEKNIGDFEVGDKVYVMAEGVVTAQSETKESVSFTIELKKASFSDKVKAFEDMTDQEQRKMMEEDMR